MDNLTPEQIQAMIAMLQNMLPKEQPENENKELSPNQFKTTKSASKKVKNTNRKTNQDSNKFNSMPEKNLHKDDAAIDKKLCVQPPVPRARRFSLIKVVCRVCGKREEVSPGLLVDSVDRYKCNKCSSSAG